MNSQSAPFKIVSGTRSRYLAEEIAKNLGVELGKMNIQYFADGEFEVCFEEPIRGCEVFIVQSTFPNSDNLMELLLMIDAAKRAFARGSLSMCEQCLDECEAIFSGNPNVWNLRASVLIALKCFADAEGWLKKVREVAPDDVVATLNFSLLYLGSSRYEDALAECDSLLISIKYKKGMDGLRHSLMFRKFLCLVMLDKVDEAKQLVADVTPMTHSPLYYYTQSVLAVIAHDRNTAIREMTAADSIYRTDPYLATYKQGITFSGILERFLPAEPQSAQ